MTALQDRLLPLLVGTGARLAAACIGLLGTMVAARALGPEGWGAWVVLFALFGWSQHVAEWGLRGVALQEGGRRGHACPGLVRDLLRARLLPLGLAIAGLVAATLLWRPELLVATVWLALALAAIAVNLDWAALVRGSPLPAGATQVLRPVLFLLAVLLLPGPLGAGGLAFATFAGWAGSAALAALELKRMPPAPFGRRPLGAGRLLSAGTPYFLVSAANQLALSADLLLVALVLGTKAAGTFGLVVTIAQTATLAAQASAQWWLAQGGLARAGSPGPARLRLVLVETGTLGLLAAAGLAVLGPPLVRHLFGPAWQAAALLLPMASLYVVLVHVSAVLAALACAQGAARQVAGLQLGSQVLSWPALLLLAGWWGLEAAVLLRGGVELARVLGLAWICRYLPAVQVRPEANPDPVIIQ
ncbi:hypothetical protein [Geminicoccus roseus]|uniref:hypothetical protein n=1 Tax=Geminicoccus roseus TaxID=404900 RepID=UPI000427700D|nr:hypothetical protein [Geminicoccus roseus]